MRLRIRFFCGVRETERRWDDIELSLGSIRDTGHEWDDDPAAWVRPQRGHDDRGPDNT
jgi:hypothetical protein